MSHRLCPAAERLGRRRADERGSETMSMYPCGSGRLDRARCCSEAGCDGLSGRRKLSGGEMSEGAVRKGRIAIWLSWSEALSYLVLPSLLVLYSSDGERFERSQWSSALGG